MSLTAHCLVKNEEVFIQQVIESVIDFVDTVLVFDTGSSDNTVAIVRELQVKYGAKIIFELKGAADHARHTLLRQEMVERTKTDWWMVLDGDEVWSRAAMQEAVAIMSNQPQIDCIIAPFYLCVGDVYHATRRAPQIEMFNKKEYWYPRFFRAKPGMRWQGDYNQDTVYNESGEVFFAIKNTAVLKHRYWHLTHLRRSSVDNDVYSSTGVRVFKLINTYFLVGKKVTETIPEVWSGDVQIGKMSWRESFLNFWPWFWRKLARNIFKFKT